jgi:hypothetical protein
MAKTFQICIKNLNGSSYFVNVNKEMTVHDLKRKLLEKEPFLHDCWIRTGTKCLSEIMNNKVMTLDDYEIHSESTIYLLARLRGGL